ncbi:hypothetical protein COP2_007795 [Malus domestica]
MGVKVGLRTLLNTSTLKFASRPYATTTGVVGWELENLRMWSGRRMGSQDGGDSEAQLKQGNKVIDSKFWNLKPSRLRIEK